MYIKWIRFHPAAGFNAIKLADPQMARRVDGGFIFADKNMLGRSKFIPDSAIAEVEFEGEWPRAREVPVQRIEECLRLMMEAGRLTAKIETDMEKMSVPILGTVTEVNAEDGTMTVDSTTKPVDFGDVKRTKRPRGKK